MPRDGSGVYSYPLGTEGIPDTTIESLKYNTYIADVQLDLNQPRPIVAGGTGASNAAVARQNIDAERAGQVVTNYDSHVWELGSFYSASTATAPPVVDHAFVGIIYGDEDHMVITASDLTTGITWTRKRIDDVWEDWVSGAAGDLSLTGNLSITKAGPTIIMNDVPGTSRNLISGQKNGVAKWEISLGNAAGYYTLSNSTIGTVYEVRTNGTVDFMAGIQVRAAPSNIAIQNMARSGASIVYNTYVNSSGATWAAVEATPSSLTVNHNSGGNVYLKAGGVNVWEARAGTVVAAYSDAYKPGGGMWLSSSDARIKTVLGEYDGGLAEVCALQPVRYQYKGNDKPEPASKFSQHQFVKGQEFVGLVAQDVERVMPELVKKGQGLIDEKRVTDLRSIDATPLIFALVNSCKELAARIEDLESQMATKSG